MDFALNLKGKHFIAGTIEVYKVANIKIGQVIFTYYLILLPGKYRCRLTYIFFAIVTENCAKSTDSFTKSYFFSQRSLYLRKQFKFHFTTIVKQANSSYIAALYAFLYAAGI